MNELSSRFQFLAEVSSPVAAADGGDRPLHVLFLADGNHLANVVRNHINEIITTSDNVITLINPRCIDDPNRLPPCEFDAVLIHYSIFILSDVYLPAAWKNHIKSFPGIRAIIHEDEYQEINNFRAAIAELGIDTVFSCLDSPETMAKVYDVDALSTVRFFSCLPGYIADNFDRFESPAVADRPLDIIYRGRDLPAQLGRLAQEKRTIGEQVKALASTYGLKTDIASEETNRIYGDAWPVFLMSGRAMLGVEGGASIFDFDGSLAASVAAYQEAHPDADFDEIWQATLKDHEGNVDFRTITPKFFEAIAARTALILYPGAYNGILRANEHYIPLNRDGSNFADVAEKLADTDGLQAMVDRTHREIMGRDDLRMTFYVKKLDLVLIGLRREQLEGSKQPLISAMRQQNTVAFQLLNELANELASKCREDDLRQQRIEDGLSHCQHHLLHINGRIDSLQEQLQRQSMRSRLRRYTTEAPQHLRRLLQKARA